VVELKNPSSEDADIRQALLQRSAGNRGRC
jgi:hypothetical protein